MIVVDTNVIAYLLIMGERTDLAQQVYKRDPEWVVPHLWRHEFLNVLASLVKFGGGELTDAYNLWHTGLNILAEKEQEVNMIEVLSLAVTHDLSGYDAQYIALAQSLECLFVTEDKKLHNTLPNQAISMQTFLQQSGV